MTYDPQKHHRKSIRIPGYDYTQPGAYFITICTHKRQTIFGKIKGGKMVLNACGEIALDEWFKTVEIRANVQLHPDEFVVMPDHLHGIIWIVESDVEVPSHQTPLKESFGKPVCGSIPTIVRAYKSATTRRINQILGNPGAPVWQRNYYERIVRGEDALRAIRRYIQQNPQKWGLG